MVSIGIITATFNEEVTSFMEESAHTYARERTITVRKTIHVPGVLDLPLPAKLLLSQTDIDAVVVLGFVRKGQTDHDQLVAHQSVRALIDLSLYFNKPIGFGIIGPNATLEQARKRAEPYTRRAVETAVMLCSISNTEK